MSYDISRRSFLIGGSVAATAALASFYVGQVEELGKLILREPTDYDRVLYADESRGFLLILDYDYDDATNTIGTRTDMTWAAYLALKGGIADPSNLKLSDFKYAQNSYDLSPRKLTETIDWDTREELWKFGVGPEAETYFYLEDLDLLSGSDESQTTHNALSTVRDDGDLHFSHDYQQGRSVYCSDLTSVALLQEKLIELGEPVKVKVI
jgi:hypothetical protein